MALQDEILKALAMGFNTNMPIYNQEIPTNVMTGKPYFQAQAPAPNFNVKPNLGKQISPALAVSQAIGGPVGNVDNQPQFNSREALNNYTGPNYKNMKRAEGQNFSDYIQSILNSPTGAGQLSEQFMNSWAAANKALPQSPAEPVDTVAHSGGNGGGGGAGNGDKKEDVSFGNFGTNIGKNREMGVVSSSPDKVNTDISYWGIPQGNEMDEYAALAASGAAKRAEQEEAQRLKEEEQRKQALQYLAGLNL